VWYDLSMEKMTIEAAIRTLRFFHECGILPNERTAKENREREEAHIVVATARMNGTYETARAKVIDEDRIRL
jgi:hypothetical protein